MKYRKKPVVIDAFQLNERGLVGEDWFWDAVSLVRTFAKFPDRAALTDTFIESLKLLTDTIESQMGEVK